MEDDELKITLKLLRKDCLPVFDRERLNTYSEFVFSAPFLEWLGRFHIETPEVELRRYQEIKTPNRAVLTFKTVAAKMLFMMCWM